MKTILAAITALFTASAAYAMDTHNLAQHGHWKVDVNVTEADTWFCDVHSHQNGSTFALYVNENGEYEIGIILSDTDGLGQAEIDLVIRIGKTKWTLYGTDVTQMGENVMLNFTIGADPKQRKFIRNFMQSTSMSIHFSDGSTAALWSLRGSSDAARALDSCRQKIMVSY